MSAPLLRLEGVRRDFGAPAQAALGPLDLELRAGEFLSLLGPSGCGKSTALRLIAGLDAPDAGAVVWEGGTAPPLGFVFQQPVLAPWSDVFDNVRLALRLKGESRAASAPAVRAALALVGLEGAERLYPRQLSGGMAMRVSLARALVAKPAALLLDEPFAALDEPTRLRLGEDVSAIAAREKLSVIFVTHSVFESAALSSRVALFSQRPGRVLETIGIDAPRPRGRDFRLSEACVGAARKISAALERDAGA